MNLIETRAQGTLMRGIIAFLTAPIPAAIVQAVVVAIWPKPERGGVFEHPSSMFLVLCLIFYVLQALLGVPLAAVIGRQRRPTPTSYALGGIAITSPILLIVGWTFIQQNLSTYQAIYNVMYFTAAGASIGMIAWFFRRPGHNSPV